MSAETYTAAILIIGDEILSGRTVDQNTPWIAEKLAEHGIKLREVRVVSDDYAAIVNAVNALRASYTYLLTTGGIGPTHDDITAAAIAQAFSVPVKEDPAARKILEDYYGTSDLNEARLKMAAVPEGAALINNPVSGAPGFKMENVYVLAGVPRIMQGMLEGFIDGLIGGDPMLSNTITCDLYESQVAKDLGALQDKYPDVSIGSYPQYRGGILGLSLVLRATDAALLDNATDEVITIIDALGGTASAVNIRGNEIKARETG
ncbi:MAG: competence/damage-inducible protein A [Alphaproteobacteria bacterium]|nr:MAG: competence/damage-inducible protein A [Alphaproteobacteria bacterium]